ncbi:helicase-related protein, partial [Morganella morganii]|uniref:helicase-related protein n=1 Tax=Morganella morganii TaxID=582 RepID=UPI0019F13C42
LLQQPDVTKAVVFVRKRGGVRALSDWLRTQDIVSCYLEGEMVQAKRNEAISRMTDGRATVLIATDVASLGIDIED